MKFTMTGKDQALEVVSLTAITAEDMPKRVKDGVPKLVNGRETYSVRGAEIVEDGKKLRDVYLSLYAPQEVKRFTPYRLEGEVVVNVYGTKTGAITTITAEKLVPVEEPETKRDLSALKMNQ